MSQIVVGMMMYKFKIYKKHYKMVSMYSTDY